MFNAIVAFSSELVRNKVGNPNLPKSVLAVVLGVVKILPSSES